MTVREDIRAACAARKPVWRVICNGAHWSGMCDTLQDALRKIGQLADREKLDGTHDWNIEIRREK